MASVYDACDAGYWFGELILPLSLFLRRCWFDDPVDANEGSCYFDVLAGLSLIRAAIVGMRKSLYLSVAKDDDGWRLVFGVNFYSISIFDIFLSKV